MQDPPFGFYLLPKLQFTTEHVASLLNDLQERSISPLSSLYRIPTKLNGYVLRISLEQ